jgi:hydroxyacylglutathione hydrolase
MILRGFPTGVFQENCFIAGCEKTRDALVVDPGADAEVILRVLDEEKLTAKLIAVTHTHMDHIGAVEAVRQATGAPVAMHRDAFAQVDQQASAARYMAGMTIDLPGGDGRVLLRSIRDKLLVLPDETVVLPGHGPETTIGDEKRENPFLLYPRAIMGIDPD